MDTTVLKMVQILSKSSHSGRKGLMCASDAAVNDTGL